MCVILMIYNDPAPTSEYFILCLYSAKAARILALLKVEGKSHFYFHKALFKSLAAAGHEVTIINPFEMNTNVENYTLIQIPIEEADENNPFNAVALKATDVISLYQYSTDVGMKECEKILRTPFIQILLKSPKRRFDVVFVEQFLTYECLLPIAEKLEVPIIGTFTGFSLSLVCFYHGNSCNPSVFPAVISNFDWKMTFFQRLQNVYYYLVDVYMREIVIKRKLKKFYDKHFPTFDLEKCQRVSLIFLNTNPSFIPSPKVPSIIDVGGIHTELSIPLEIPEDIQRFIDEAPDGVILFSLGSIVSGPVLTPKLRAAFKAAFAQVPQRVIWKFDENIPVVSDNVMMSKWVPQKEILAHPNVVAFMSHCGAMSTFEAIYAGKPMILIPVFADQPSTAARLAELDVGVLLDIASFTCDDLVKLIREIVRSPKYTQNMRELSDTVKDLPISPSESIVYWTEYVLRHNGAGHLKSMASDIPFYQYLLLDVTAFVVTVFILSVSVLIYLCKKIYRSIIPAKKMNGIRADIKKKQ